MPAITNAKRGKKPHIAKATLVGNHLVVDPRVCHGQLTFRGPRVPVEMVLSYLAQGFSLSYLRKSWPEVSAEMIQEAINLEKLWLARIERPHGVLVNPDGTVAGTAIGCGL